MNSSKKPKQIVEKLADKVSEEYEPSINRDQTRLEKRAESSPRPLISQVPEAAEDQQLVFEEKRKRYSLVSRLLICLRLFQTKFHSLTI